jgi:8-oxo-dGTP pyrophosphatase MutT (NUDIX family)
MKKPAAKASVVSETSAGGVVLREGETLLVKVRNLQGKIVWTFPKGHLEAGETSEQAAVREVREETGWACRVTRELMTVRYGFEHAGRSVKKTVHWFVMAPVAREGEPDPGEILDARWCDFAAAADLVVYDSDKKILTGLKKRTAGRA